MYRYITCSEYEIKSIIIANYETLLLYSTRSCKQITLPKVFGLTNNAIQSEQDIKRSLNLKFAFKATC